MYASPSAATIASMPPLSATVVCISHAEGADGYAVGQAVAARLGFRLADDSIVVDAARSEGLFPEALSLAEHRNAGRRIEVDFGRVERTEDLRDLIAAAVVRTAEEGNVVIVSHAASYPLAPRPDVLRVFVTASLEKREERVADDEGLDATEAARRVADSDRGRAAYLDRFYGVKRELPTDYDLVVNTDRLPIADAAALVAAACAAGRGSALGDHLRDRVEQAPGH
jgi:cytidylate kinase